MLKLGLVKNWDGPRRRFVYLFEAGDNDTLEIVELQSQIEFVADLPCNRELNELPGEVAAEINISMGHAGRLALRPTWWGKQRTRFWRFRQRVHLRWIKLVRRPT